MPPDIHLLPLTLFIPLKPSALIFCPLKLHFPFFTITHSALILTSLTPSAQNIFSSDPLALTCSPSNAFRSNMFTL